MNIDDNDALLDNLTNVFKLLMVFKYRRNNKNGK